MLTPIAAYWGALAIGMSLGLLGSGGSILTVPILVYIAGEPEKLAITESLAIVGTIAAIGTLLRARQRHIDWRTLRMVAPTAMLGSYGGAWLSQFISGRAQMLLFSVVMLMAGWRMFVSARQAGLQPSYCRPRCLLALGMGLGVMSGIIGVGGGFLIVPSLVLLGGLALPMAVGTSVAIICVSTLTGFLKHLHLLHVAGMHLDWRILSVFVALGIAGTVLSQPIARHVPQRSLQQVYSLVIAIVAALIIWHHI